MRTPATLLLVVLLALPGCSVLDDIELEQELADDYATAAEQARAQQIADNQRERINQLMEAHRATRSTY